MNLKKTKKAVAFLCAVALIGSTSYQMVGNSLSVSASTESTVSNFNVVSEDTFDWNNWDFGESIPSSEKMSFGEDEEIWGEDIVYNNDFSLVTEEEREDGIEKIYQWNIPATEIKFLGGITGKDTPSNVLIPNYLSQQMLFGEKIQNAFTVQLHIFGDERVSYIDLIPNQELNNDVKGFVLPDNMDITFGTQLFNDSFDDEDLISSYDYGLKLSKKYLEGNSDRFVTYSLPRVVSSRIAQEDGYNRIVLNLEVNENAKENGGTILIFGKKFTLNGYNGELKASTVTQMGRSFDCSSEKSSQLNHIPSFCSKNYNVSVTLDKHNGDATFDFCFNQDNFLKIQEYMYGIMNQITDEEQYYSATEGYKRIFKDMFTVEVSTKSKEVADNIITALKTDYNGFYTDCGYRIGKWEFEESNLSLTSYENEGETYYRIKYCPIDDEDFEYSINELTTKVLFKLSSISFKIPSSKLIDSTGGNSTMLIGVPYDFYEDNDYYEETLSSNIVDFKEVLSQLEIEVETGDVDGNGVINSLDLMRLKKYILGVGNPLTVFNKYGADVNDDGNINVLDVIALKKILLTK